MVAFGPDPVAGGPSQTPSRPHLLSQLRPSPQRRADVDELAHRLRHEGLTFQAFGDRLGVSADMARRRVVRYEPTLREAQPNKKAAPRSGLQ